jgi:hypothetical protein
LRAVELDVNEPRSKNAAVQVDDLVRRQVQLIKGFLVAQDFTRERIYPQVLLDELTVFEDAAVGEFGDARLRVDLAGGHDVTANLLSVCLSFYLQFTVETNKPAEYQMSRVDQASSTG